MRIEIYANDKGRLMVWSERAAATCEFVQSVLAPKFTNGIAEVSLPNAHVEISRVTISQGASRK